MTHTRLFFSLGLGLLTCVGLAPASHASDAASTYPERAVTFVVPLSPGGGVDAIARLLAAQLSETLQQPFLVENRPGAATNIGSEYVARAAPDGYTLLFTGNSHTVNRSLFTLRFDAQKDFTPITNVVESTQVLLVHRSVPASNVAELIALARQMPGQLNYGSAGVGAPSHIAGAVFEHLAKIDMTHVPYKGAGPATNDLLGGQIDILFSSLPSAVPHFSGDRIKPLAVSSAQRFPAVPDLPTLAESGVAGYNVGTWFGLFAPAGLDTGIRDKLASTIANVLAKPEVVDTLAKQGMIPIGNSPADFAAQLDAEFAFWPAFVQETGIQAD